MTPDWYPKADALPGILADIARLVGVPVALRFAETFGGQRVYVPRPRALDKGHAFVRGLGLRAARHLAEQFQGEYLKVPNARVELHALACRRLWLEGHSVNDICRITHLTRSRVQRHVAGLPRGEAAPAAEVVDHCPACGRRHRRLKPDSSVETDERQMAFPWGDARRPTPDA